MKVLRPHFSAFSDQYRIYFREASDQIARQNLQLLRDLSLVTALLLLFFFLFTPVVLPDWTITIQHILFLPASLVFFLTGTLYQKSKLSRRYVPLVCLLFQVVLFTFVLLIDLLAAPDTPASFMPGLCIALPVLFVMPFRLSYGLMAVFELLYILVAVRFKDPFLAQYDVFNSVVGIAFSVAVAEVTMRLRLRDYGTRMKYKQMSMLDPLSGMLNKLAWTESVKQYLWLCGEETTCALAILDVDGFKQINDRLGHFTGDQILRDISAVLIETFRAEDLVGRFGGDEFVVLMKGAALPAVLEKRFQRIGERFSRISVGESGPPVTCSIGVAVTQGKAMEFDALFQAADAALYQAKGRGKNTFVIHNCAGAAKTPPA